MMQRCALFIFLICSVFGNISADEFWLHHLDKLKVIDRLHADERFEEALCLLDDLLNGELTFEERGWCQLKKGAVLLRLSRPDEALEIFGMIDGDEFGISLISSVNYYKSKAYSQLGQEMKAIDAINLAMTQSAWVVNISDRYKQFRIQQMRIRLGRYVFKNDSFDAEDALSILGNVKEKLLDLAQQPLLENDLQKMIWCELSVACKECMSIFLAIGDKEQALVSCEQAIEYARLNKSKDPNHPWIIMLLEACNKICSQIGRTPSGCYVGGLS